MSVSWQYTMFLVGIYLRTEVPLWALWGSTILQGSWEGPRPRVHQVLGRQTLVLIMESTDLQETVTWSQLLSCGGNASEHWCGRSLTDKRAYVEVQVCREGQAFR